MADTSKQQHAAVINLAATKLGLSGDELTQALTDARKDLGLNQHPQLAKLVRQELGVAATTLGYADAKATRKDLSGTTLTALAAKHNVPAATLASAIKADVDGKIQALVTTGKLNANRAASIKVKADAKVDAFMTRQFK